MFFKIESWNFQHLFEIEFREASQNFNSFSSFYNCYFPFFYQLSDWAEILQGFMKFNFKLNLKVSAFYLEKQKSFIPKKKFFFGRTAKIHPKDGVSRLNFPEGFGKIIAKIDSEFWKCLSAQFFGNSYIPKRQTSFKKFCNTQFQCL